MPRSAPRKAVAPAAEARPERPTKAQLEAERFPNLDKNPALRRALAIHRAMLGGKSREAAEKLAEEKYGPRSPRTKPKRGKRPAAPQRQRVKPTPTRAKAPKAKSR